MIQELYGKINHERLFLISSILVVITLPFSIPLNSFAIILFFSCWLISSEWREKFRLLKSNRVALLFIGFYFYHAVGVLYSSNVSDGLYDLEKKISFVVFPLVISTTKFINRQLVEKVLLFFIGACFFASLACLSNGVYHAIHGDFSFLFYHKLGSLFDFHAVYFSLYIGFSIFVLVCLLTQYSKTWLPAKKWKCISLIVYFAGFLVLLSSKIFISAVFLLLIAKLTMHLFGSMGFWRGAIAFILFGGTITSTVLFIPEVKERFKDVIVDEYDQTNPLFLDDYAQYHFTAGAIRLAIWKMAVQLVNKENAWIFGVGTGDPQDLLTATYVEKHIYPGDGVHVGFIDYNTHNQFFQFYVALGLLGVTWFVTIIVSLARAALKNKDSIFGYFLLLFVLFSLIESTLCRQKGVVFFSFFSLLLFVANEFKAIVVEKKK